MRTIVVVAFAEVCPVTDKYVAVGPVQDVDASKPRVIPQQKIGPMSRLVSRLMQFDDVSIDAIAMQVGREQRTVELLRPGAAAVDHGTRVCMPTSCFAVHTYSAS